MLATIYGRLPPGERARLNAPSPELIEKGMRQRFAAAFSQYRVAIAEVDEFKTLVDKHGLPVFLRAVFPKQAAPEASPGKSGADGKKKN